METLTVSHESVSSYIPRDVFTTKEDEASLKLRGLAASLGSVEGPCTIIRNLEELPTLRDGAILVCETPSPALVPYMRFLRGLVAERGGSLCRFAMYAREFEIPAVVGVGDVMDAIHTGDVIRIDGSRGTVEITG